MIDPSAPFVRPLSGAVVVALALALVTVVPVSGQAADPDARQIVPIPPSDVGWDMLEVRKFGQLEAAKRLDVFHDFRFEDRQPASGIDFVHRITPDSGKFYQPNHYDHGNGVVIADVDGDDLHDIYFVSQLGGHELWRNRGDGTFEDITDTAGVRLADRVGASAAFADVDNDGDPDLFVTSIRTGNVLFENDGSGRFSDVSRWAGLDYSGHSSGAVFFDYDNDGLLDLFLTNVGTYTVDEKSPEGHWLGIGWVTGTTPSAFDGHVVPERTEYSILYRNLGDGCFEDVSEAVGLRDAGWAGDASFTDLNGDRWPDLYVLNMQGDDHYYENSGGSRFTERTAEVFPRTPWGTMGIKFFDYDNDGHQDLLLTDMHSDMSRDVTPGYEKLKSLITLTEEQLQGGENNIFGNAFFENQGDGTFTERSDELGVENYWPWGVSVGDLNADGFEDVFIASSMNFPFRYGVNTVLLNSGGSFHDSEFVLGVEPRVIQTTRPWYSSERGFLATKKPWFDVDCGPGLPAHPMCRNMSGKLTVFANVGSRSSVIFDYDRDGDLDIVTSEFNDRPQVLTSNLSEQTEVRYLEVELVGKESNRDGLGARVTVRAGGRDLGRYHDGKSGYLSQSSMPLYFGLAGAAAVESVTVEWPAGGKQVVTEGLELGTRIRIVEGG